MSAEWGRRIGLRVLAIAVLGVLWQVTAVVMDNPTFIPSPAAHRVMHRITLRGDVPVGPATD